MAVADLLRRDEADVLVREAHHNVHRYPPGFPGFRARIRVSTEDAVAVGRAVVPAEGTPRIDVDASPATRDWTERELASLADHRRHHDYSERDGRWAKDVTGTPEDALGRVVHLSDPLHSSYRIERGHITRIGRTLPEGRLSVLVQDWAPSPDGRWVATHFVVLFQDEVSGAITSAEAYRDAYVEVDGLLLPARRRVSSLTTEGSAVREIVLEHHEPLAEGVAS